MSRLCSNSIFIYTIYMKYVLNLFNSIPDLQIIKDNLSKIDANILRILNKLETKEDGYSISQFVLLSRARFYILNLENLNNSEKCTSLHYELFFLFYFGLIDVLNKFRRKTNPDIAKCFHKSISELRKAIGPKIVNENKLSKYISFIRAISFAHIASTNTAGGFLNMNVNNSYFILTSIYPFKMSCPKGENNDKNKEAFYFHTTLKIDDNCKSVIFSVYVDDLEHYIIELLDNIDFSSLT